VSYCGTTAKAGTAFPVQLNNNNNVRMCLGYRSGGPGPIPGTTRKKVVGLERGPISLVRTIKELLDRKVAAPV
jgi:hypothetical protein